MKELLKDKRVIGLIVSVAVATASAVIGFDVKEAICGVESKPASSVEKAVEVVGPEKAK